VAHPLSQLPFNMESVSYKGKYMSVTVRIGEETRSLAEATESWINQQINRRRSDGQSVCVEVSISTSGLNLRLATPGCGSGGGGGRPPSANERAVLELWGKRGLDSSGFAGGNLVAFLKQLQRLLG
jgi:hypothetical protein